MGICCSGEAKSKSTAKLIHLDGELEEFSTPVSVAELVRNRPNNFICNSNEMEFDEFVLPAEDDVELQPGQLYFELPLTWLTQKLQAEDMASLAVKASLALRARGEKPGCFKNRRRVDDLVFSDKRDVGLRGIDGGFVRKKNRGNKGYKLTKKLSLILEEEE